MRSGFGVVVCLALSCASPPATAPAQTPFVPPAPATSSGTTFAPPSSVKVVKPDEKDAPSPSLDASCEKLQTTQRELIRRARVSDEELRGGGDRVPAVIGSCLRQPRTHGAWVIAMEAIADGGCPDRGCATLRFHLVHLADDGSRADGPVQSIAFAAGTLSLDVGALFDWDGDGTPEILVRTKVGHVACNRPTTAIERAASLWQFHTGAIVLSPISVEDARDTDQDGRLDLVSRGPYAAVADRPCMANAPGDSSTTLVGPELLLRSKTDGTFALLPEDAKKSCPEAPSGIVARPKKGRLDVQLTARNVVCARMWGARTGEIVPELDRHRAQLCDQERGRCAEIDILRDWATKDPPLLLAR